MRIALIGFGVMGQCVAAKLAETGHEIIVTDPMEGSETRAREAGYGFTPEPDRSVEVALLFLPGPDQIRTVVPTLVEGGDLIVVDHSTADPGTARDMAEIAVANSCGWLDAPVLGRPGSVGSWTLPVGGTDGALATCQSLFTPYAREVFDMGGPGNGHQVKLLNQMMFGAINAMTAEMMATAVRLGLPPARLYEIMTASQAGTVSNLFKELGARIAMDRFDEPTFSVDLLEKDVRLGLEMARDCGIDPPIGNAVDSLNKSAIAKGYGPQDTACMWHSLADE